jgi:hypothetical protein
LQALYLDPLRRRIKRNGGRVFPGGPECTLLIDLKSDWQSIYPVLRSTLSNYTDIITTFRDGAKQTNAITAIITGDRAKEMFAGESIRYATFDGDLPDVNSIEPADLVPWVSSNWSKSFRWTGRGAMSDEEKKQLREMVAKAHQHGRKVRFWGAPDKPEFWQAMLENDVDLINTDDLAGVQKFFEGRGR